MIFYTSFFFLNCGFPVEKLMVLRGFKGDLRYFKIFDINPEVEYKVSVVDNCG